jgi:tRNA(Ile)-lysidine synthase TilS/MesJ
MLWKVNDFKRQPCPNIILGDSRTTSLDTALIAGLTGERYYNLAVQGCSIEEMYELFWFANDLTRLKKVYITISLQNYSETYQRNLFAKVLKIYNFPLLMFTERFIIGIAWQNLLKWADDGSVPSPKTDRRTVDEKRMNDHIKVIRAKLKKYTYSETYREKMEEIAAYCKANGIELVFINFPSYATYRELVRETGMEEAERRFLADFTRLAPVYDFNYLNEISLNRENYKDLHHMRREVYDEMCREIWGGQIKYARILMPGTTSNP